MSSDDNLIRLTTDEMTKLAALEGRLIDYGKEIARAREAGLTTDLDLDKKEEKRLEMIRKIKKMKHIYQPLT